MTMIYATDLAGMCETAIDMIRGNTCTEDHVLVCVYKLKMSDFSGGDTSSSSNKSTLY